MESYVMAKTAKWVIDVLEIAEVPKNSDVGITCPPQKGGGINRPAEPRETHPAWPANKKSWKPLCSRETVAELPAQRHGGMTSTTGVLQWITVNSSEGISKTGGWGRLEC